MLVTELAGTKVLRGILEKTSCYINVPEKQKVT